MGCLYIIYPSSLLKIMKLKGHTGNEDDEIQQYYEFTYIPIASLCFIYLIQILSYYYIIYTFLLKLRIMTKKITVTMMLIFSMLLLQELVWRMIKKNMRVCFN